MFKCCFDPLAKDRGLVEGLGADESEESAKVGELVLDGRTSQTPPRVGMKSRTSLIEGSRKTADDMGLSDQSSIPKSREMLTIYLRPEPPCTSQYGAKLTVGPYSSGILK